MAASGILQNGNVIFYHPLDNATENTQSQVWTGTAGFVPGKIGSANSAVTSGSFSYGTKTEMDNMATAVQSASKMDMVALSSTKVVAFYRDEDDSRIGKARVGTVSGNDITWSAAVAFTGANMNRKFSALALSATSVVVIYRGLPTAVAGVVSGTDITFGSSITVREGTSVGGVTPYDCLDKLSSTQAICTTGQIIGGSFTPSACVLTVSGLDVTTGTVVTYAGANDFHPFSDKCVALSSAAAVVFYFNNVDSTLIRARVATISGTDITFGSEITKALSAGINTDGNLSVTAIDATHFVVAAQQTNGAGEGVVGTVSGTDITFGAVAEYNAAGGGGDAGANPRIRKIDSTSVALVFQKLGTDDGGKTRVGTISGSDITWGATTEWTTAFSGGAEGQPQSLAVLGSGAIAIAWFDVAVTTEYESIVGQVSFTAGLEAPTPAAYPSTIGDTRVAMAMWTNNPTLGDATIIVQRGYIVTMDATSIALGGTTATWTGGIGTLMTSLNDGTSHLLVMCFEHVSGTTWNLKTSIDGAAFVDQGNQDAGTQAVTTADTAPRLDLSDVAGDAGQWVDELVMWTGDGTFECFTNQELTNLFDLADTFGDPMTGYEGNFGAPICWQATALVNGRPWSDSGSGPCPATVRVPRGAEDIVVTDDGEAVHPRVIEG